MTTKATERIGHLIDGAMSLQRAGDKQGALRVLLQARDDAPDSATVHLLLGVTYLDLEQVDNAEASLRRALALDALSTEAARALGLLLSKQGRADEAVTWLGKVLAADRADVVVLKRAVSDLEKLRRRDDAIALARQCWDASGEPEAGNVLARLLLRGGKRRDAETVLSAVVQAAERAQPLIEAAGLFLEAEKPARALKASQRAADLEPGSPAAWSMLSQVLVVNDRSAEALTAAERALSCEGADCVAWLAKGRALLGLNRYQESFDSAQHGIECVAESTERIDRAVRSLKMLQVTCLLRLRRVDDALIQLTALRGEYPTDDQFVGRQVSLLMGRRRYTDALQVLDEARQAGIADMSNLAALRYQTLHALGRPSEAWAFVEPQLGKGKARERRLDILRTGGVNLYRLGEIQAALSVFRQLSELAPEQPFMISNVGFVLTGEGELREAESLFRRALEIEKSSSERATIHADLGYLRLIQGDLQQARDNLEAALLDADADDEAILRVAYWSNERVQQDFIRHPVRFVPTRLGVKANLVTLSLAEGRPADAQSLAQEMIAQAPDDALGHMMLGWVEQSLSNPEGARQAWQSALEHTKNKQERDIIQTWLAHLT